MLKDLRQLAALETFFEGRAAMAEIVGADAAAMQLPWSIALLSPDMARFNLLSDYALRVRAGRARRCEVFFYPERAIE